MIRNLCRVIAFQHWRQQHIAKQLWTPRARVIAAKGGYRSITSTRFDAEALFRNSRERPRGVAAPREPMVELALHQNRAGQRRRQVSHGLARIENRRADILKDQSRVVQFGKHLKNVTGHLVSSDLGRARRSFSLAEGQASKSTLQIAPQGKTRPVDS